jgi:hypothetical protein
MRDTAQHIGRIRLLEEKVDRTLKLGPPMTITFEQIEAEHNAALASLTTVQRRAIRFPADNLKTIFAAEAESRSLDRAAA